MGAGAKMLDGVTIGAHAIVGAGAVVTADVPDRGGGRGSPARIDRLARRRAGGRWNEPASLVVTSGLPFGEGGHLVIARSLVQALREAGHQAEVRRHAAEPRSAARRRPTSRPG